MKLEVKWDNTCSLRKYCWSWLGTLASRNDKRRKNADRLFRDWIAFLEAAEPEPLSWLPVAEIIPENHRLQFQVLLARP